MVDLCNTNDAILLDQNIDLILQQIEMLFDTHPGDVIGDYQFGADFEEYLFNTTMGNQVVAERIAKLITSNVDMFDWDIHVDVEFLAGSQHDILMMRVSIYKEDETYSKIYKVTQGDVKKWSNTHNPIN